MKKSHFSFFSPLPCLLIFVFFSCKKPQPVEFRNIENLSLDEVSGDSVTIRANVVFFNPNDFALSFKNLSADFYANEALISHYSLDTLFDAPPATETKIPVKIRAGVQPILNNALSSFLNREIRLRIKGKTKVGYSNIFINVPFEFTKDQKINLF